MNMTDPTMNPAQPDLSNLPVHVDRQRAAELVTHFYFRVSPRTLERWPLTGKVLNGRLTFPTAEVFRLARERIDAAPAIKGGPASATRTA
ncbi:hypothetical protein D9599_05800 [Roseomonas sp. KE2513]|uniref:hypothetical protein n=1 Tax=Roseomonas sp. KE2513 TaxID=2479202 RepID=UPI0018DEFADA|nr:hypothetical protein [Roseomonas sp. KE2513]MBI0535086.1 hypothetical protein [Roseomonas sp. KE2513]